MAKRLWIFAVLLTGSGAPAQTTPEPFPAVATMKQVMLDFIHPASNDIILLVARGGPKDEKDWAVARRSAVTLAESGNLLLQRGRMRDQGDWVKDAKALADVGTAAYQVAQAKDADALAKLTPALDLSCTACHKQYRPNVFPREGASK